MAHGQPQHRSAPFKSRLLAGLVRDHFATAALGLACALPLVAMAQATEPEKKDEKKATTLPEVKVKSAIDKDYKIDASSTATRTETPLRDIPQFINTVPEALLRAQNATTLQEALRNVPGVSYAAAEGGTQANQVFYLRGFPAGGDIFIDGVRDLGEYNRDVFATESVEVLKGPSALTYGRGSTGGVINQTSRIPGIVDRKEVAATFGNFNIKRFTADYNAPLGNDNAMRVVALYEDSDYYRYPQGIKKAGFAPSVRFGVGHPVDVTLSYYYLKSEDVIDYGQPTLTPAFTGNGRFAMPNVSAENYYGYANHDYSEHETNILTAKVDWRIDKDTTLRNITRIANYKRQLEATIATLSATDMNGAPVTPNTPMDLLRVTRNHDGGRTRDSDDDAIINQTDVIWKLKSGTTKHTVLGGLELAREKLDRINYVLDANPNQAGTQAPTSFTSFLNPDPNTPTLTYTKTPNINALAEGKTAATYLQDQIEFNDQWKALVGVRYDYYKAEAETKNIVAGTQATGPFSRTEKMWSGRAGVIYQPTPMQSYYVSIGNSYNPSGELGVYGQNGTNLNPINVNLDPEENVGYEMGATWDFSHGLQVRGAIFRNEKTNARRLDELGATVLTGKRRVDGIEIQLAGYITPNWEIYSGVAFMDGKITSSNANQGNVPLGVADVAGNIWTVYKLGGGWEIGGGVRGTSGFFLTDANNGEVPGAAVVDLTAAYVRANWEVRLNVQNVGDKLHYIGGYNNQANRVIPGEPRTYAVTLRYTF